VVTRTVRMEAKRRALDEIAARQSAADKEREVEAGDQVGYVQHYAATVLGDPPPSWIVNRVNDAGPSEDRVTDVASQVSGIW
jgi:hypothetical protein